MTKITKINLPGKISKYYKKKFSMPEFLNDKKVLCIINHLNMTIKLLKSVIKRDE